AAGFALGIGTLAAYVALTAVMDVTFAFSASAIAQALGFAGVMIIALGLLSTSLVLRTPPVPLLKAE
ncbi:MAG: hypothetical protein HC774_07545, partial [Sphingomonadales bacterium]|nr:hypothetical protein [Sphingomonadales bacterium]